MHTTTSMMRRTLTSTMRVVGMEQQQEHLTRLAPQRRALRVPCSIACLKLSRVQYVASLVWQVLPLRATTMLTSTAMDKITGMLTSTSMHTTTSTSVSDFLFFFCVLFEFYTVDNQLCKSNYMINCPPAYELCFIVPP